MNIVEITKKYFEHFSNQDLDALSELFCEDITLKDWENDISGKEKVLDVIRGIFVLTPVIEIIPAVIACIDNTAMAEILISAGDTALEVVDVIEYENDKIISIRAYKI